MALLPAVQILRAGWIPYYDRASLFRGQPARRSLLEFRRQGEVGTTRTINLLPMVELLPGGETRRPIELVAFGMGSDQGVGAQLEEVAAIFESEFSNHAFEPL